MLVELKSSCIESLGVGFMFELVSLNIVCFNGLKLPAFGQVKARTNFIRFKARTASLIYVIRITQVQLAITGFL